MRSWLNRLAVATAAGILTCTPVQGVSDFSVVRDTSKPIFWSGMISNRNQFTKLLDAWGGTPSLHDGSPVKTGAFLDGANANNVGSNQKWVLWSDGTIRTASASGDWICLDSAHYGNPDDKKDKLTVFNCFGGLNQYWDWHSDQTIENRGTGYCLDVLSGDFGVQIGLSPCNSNSLTQRFSQQPPCGMNEQNQPTYLSPDGATCVTCPSDKNYIVSLSGATCFIRNWPVSPKVLSSQYTLTDKGYLEFGNVMTSHSYAAMLSYDQNGLIPNNGQPDDHAYWILDTSISPNLCGGDICGLMYTTISRSFGLCYDAAGSTLSAGSQFTAMVPWFAPCDPSSLSQRWSWSHYLLPASSGKYQSSSDALKVIVSRSTNLWLNGYNIGMCKNCDVFLDVPNRDLDSTVFIMKQ